MIAKILAYPGLTISISSVFCGNRRNSRVLLAPGHLTPCVCSRAQLLRVTTCKDGAMRLLRAACLQGQLLQPCAARTSELHLRPRTQSAKKKRKFKKHRSLHGRAESLRLSHIFSAYPPRLSLHLLLRPDPWSGTD